MSGTFVVEFVVTEKCNLACKYCYMKNRPKVMTKVDVDNFLRTIDFFLKYYNLDKYHISYFGGEPLLNWEIIQYSVPLFRSDSRNESITIITNGLLLTREKYDWLRENQVGISLSFDGLWNEFNRPLVNGKSSLELYKKKKWLFKELQGCKVMVAPSSVETLVDNFEFLVNEMDIRYPDFSLVRDNIWTDSDIEKFDVEVRKLADKYIEYVNRGIDCSVGFFRLMLLDILVGKKFGKRPFGCFAGVNGCAYFPGGKYYPCARFGSNNLFLLYDMQHGPIYENLDKLFDPNIHNPQTYEKCQNCPLYKFCNAGCLFSQMEQFNFERAGPVESICKLYFILYDVSYYVYENLKHDPKFIETLRLNLR